MANLARARELAEGAISAIDMAVRAEQSGRAEPERIRQRIRQAAHALRAAADELLPLNLDAGTELPTADLARGVEAGR